MRRPYAQTADAAGNVTISITPSDYRGWRIFQVGIEMKAGTAATVAGLATCVMRVNGSYVTPIVAQGDAPSGDPPVDLQPGDTMTIEWTNCTPGNLCAALVFYEALT